ncbi:MAG: hypothetical protein D3908_03355, partial [Candidatus Electrothrix sp. AUS4]|nr:hypothetical protein [Candidatus Electrothrix sp. AUS4]
MQMIQWCVELNYLTVPSSYKIRFVPRGSIGTDDLVIAMHEENPNCSVEKAKTMLALQERIVQKKLLCGGQVIIDGMLNIGFSFTGSNLFFDPEAEGCEF